MHQSLLDAVVSQFGQLQPQWPACAAGEHGQRLAVLQGWCDCFALGSVEQRASLLKYLHNLTHGKPRGYAGEHALLVSFAALRGIANGICVGATRCARAERLVLSAEPVPASCPAATWHRYAARSSSSIRTLSPGFRSASMLIAPCRCCRQC